MGEYNQEMARTQYFIKLAVDKPVTKKEFLVAQKKAALKDRISRARLLKNKTFTISQIDKLIKDKVLVPIRYRAKIYFSIEEVENGLKSNPEVKKIKKPKKVAKESSQLKLVF